MAKKPVLEAKGVVGTPKEAEPAQIVTVNDLSEEFGISSRQIRILLRKAGFVAPKVESEGFGPRSKYQWTKGSAELAEARTVIQAGLTSMDAEED